MDILTILLLLVIVGLVVFYFVHQQPKTVQYEVLEERLTSLESEFLHTVRSLSFFEGGMDGKKITTARLTSKPVQIIDSVAEGKIQMRLLPSSAGLASTLASMAAEEGSKLLNHSHQHYVDIFVAEGEAVVTSSSGTESAAKGSALHFKPGEEKSIEFTENSVLVWTFTPQLEEETI